MFTRVRIMNGIGYLYEEIRYREGGKVRSKSTYKGRVDRIVRAHNWFEQNDSSAAANEVEAWNKNHPKQAEAYEKIKHIEYSNSKYGTFSKEQEKEATKELRTDIQLADRQEAVAKSYAKAVESAKEAATKEIAAPSDTGKENAAPSEGGDDEGGSTPV